MINHRRQSFQPAFNSNHATIPDGQRVYAIGDIHGRIDLLEELLLEIAADVVRYPVADACLIFLGDYVDRGPGSRQVIDRLLTEAPAPCRAIHLLGNHEDWMMRFLSDASVGPGWLQNGSATTLASYGVTAPNDKASPIEWERAHHALRQTIPNPHLAFLKELRLWHQVGGYLFVHAGIRPGVPLTDQNPRDLIWIREPFLSSEADFGVVVVHGHTIVDVPQCRPNRIGIDTGAFATGRLTALVLEGTSRRFLMT